jgi:hypothetical protein
MVRIDGQAFRLFLPALADGLIRGQAGAGVESFREILGHQEGMQMRVQVGMGLLVIRVDGGLFARTVPPFHLAVGPRMGGVGPPMVHAIRMTHAVNEGVQGVEIAWAMRDLEAVIGAPRRALVGHGRPPGPSDLSGDQWVRIGMPLGRGQLTGAVNGDPPGALACVRPPLGAVEVAGAARLGRKLFLARLGVGHVREAAEAMPLKTTRPCRSGELRPCRVKRLAAVIQGQPRGATTGDEAGGLLQRSERRMALCRPHRGRINVRAVLPLGSRLRVSIVARGQRREAFLTLLERATPGRGRAGAAVEEWSHQASREGTSPDHTPSHPGTKHLGSRLAGCRCQT